MSDLRSLAGGIVGLAGVAFRSFLTTFFIVLLAGALLAGVSYYYLRDHPFYGALAVVVALAESLIVGLVFGAKRAVVTALAHGFRTLGLGRRVVGTVFDRLSGERGEWVAQRLESLPLAQAEKGLDQAVRHVVNVGASEGASSGWVRPRLEKRLLGLVQKVTLARFREEGAERGGVNVARVRTDLESRIDDVLVAKIRGGLKLWTVIVLLGLPFTVFVQTYILIAWLNAK